MNILVNCRGFIGDVLFASSVSKKLKEKYEGCVVHYRIPVIQPVKLLEQNPYIDRVIVPKYQYEFELPKYDMRIDLPDITQEFPVTIQYQAAAGIEDQSTEFDVYTVPEYDAEAEQGAIDLHLDHETPNNVTVVGWQANWAEKSFGFTEEEYQRGVDIPFLGYGGRHRDIDKIISLVELYGNGNIELVRVGFGNGVGQYDPRAADPELYAQEASLIKACDYFIGSEGGLSNLAAAVGTKCIITTDFIWQLYGPNGVFRKLSNPQMGPAVYYPNGGHSHLNPFLTDEDVAMAIDDIIRNTPCVDDNWWRLS